MNIVFFSSDKPRERILADAFMQGAKVHGDTASMVSLTGEPLIARGAEIAVMVGVKSRELFYANMRAGLRVVMIDKGYSRHKSETVRGWEFWRVAVNAHHPTRYLMQVPRPSDRLDRLGLRLDRWRKYGNQILIAGSSAKYHEFYGLVEPNRYTRKLVRTLQGLSPNRPIVYRPKPSWREAEAVDGTHFSRSPETLEQVLSGAHVLVTHGSNACFEAMLAGVPSIVLGDGVAKPLSSTTLEDIEALRLASDEDRHQWLANLAYAQFTESEFASGEAWSIVRPQIFG